MTLGIAYDRSANPLTGDKPRQPDRGAGALSAAYRLPLGSGWSVAASGGRRHRFPSARELFGEALGRFLPNPDLKPERAWLGDFELNYAGAQVTAQLNPFVSRATDTIAQRVVSLDGRRLRQRYNLAGSLAYGIDAALNARLGERIGVEVSATALRARVDGGAEPFRRLLQRPGLELAGAVTVDPVARLNLRAEVRHIGAAVDLDANGNRAPLGAGTEINLRGRWGIADLPRGNRLTVAASVDNVANGVITPQLGLPSPGRSVRIGLQFN